MRAETELITEQLANVPENGKAEIIDGEMKLMSPTGGQPSRAAIKILLSLYGYEQDSGLGYAFQDNTGFIVDLPNRKSFSPDAAFYIRSEGDHGAVAEQEMAAKRADYFAAGTKVVWDVDVLREKVVRVYRSDQTTTPTVYVAGQVAEAEPALPGWSMFVDDLLSA